MPSTSALAFAPPAARVASPQALVSNLYRFVGHPAGMARTARRADRIAAPYLLTVTPIDGVGGPTIAAGITGAGKDISRLGLGFFHQQPLPYRFVRVNFEDARLGELAVELELCRCRFSNLGWYESGGKLLRVIESRHAA